MKLPARFFLSATSAFALLADARAQTTPDVTTLAPFTVTGVPVEQSVNPLTRLTSSVMGDARDPLDTPRGVSTITTALFNERQIHGVQEILLYSPSAYVGAAYGNITMQNLRCDLAETYLKGQRLRYNYFGYFPSF